MIRNTRQLLGLTAALAILLPTVAGAGFYTWQAPTVGDWGNPDNWDPTGYPKNYWDFANFESPEGVMVNATDPTTVSAIAGLSVRAGDVQLQTHDALRVIAVIGGAGVPASLTLSMGGITALGSHRVAADGLLRMAPGTSLEGAPSNGPGVVIEAAGELQSAGMIRGTGVQCFGTVSPGSAAGNAGRMEIQSSAGWTQYPGSRLVLDILGPEAGTSHDQVRVIEGTLELAGTIEIVLGSGYVPDAGALVLVESPVLLGEFSSVILPEVAGREFTLTREDTRIVLEITTPILVEAEIDVLPGSCRNPFSRHRRGVIPVALLGSSSLDVSQVDPTLLALNGVAPLRWHLEDVSSARDPEMDDGCPGGPDGIPDLVMHVSARDLRDSWGSTPDDAPMIHMVGTAPDGQPLNAEDIVTLVGGGKGKGTKKTNEAVTAQTDYRLSLASSAHASMQRVRFALPVTEQARLDVYDVTGRRITSWGTEALVAGNHERTWNSAGLSRGVYFYRLQTPNRVLTAKLVLLP